MELPKRLGDERLAEAVYLDTAHWINLAEGRIDRLRFEKAIEEGRISPTLSFIHVLELANQAEDSRRRVSRYIDHVRGIGAVKWVRGLRQVTQEEALAALERHLKLTPRRVSVFGDQLVDVLADRIDWLATAEAREYSVERVTELVAGLDAAAEHQQLREQFPSSRAFVRVARAKRIRFTQAERLNWLVSLLPNSALLGDGILCKITDQVKQDFRLMVNPSDCPAFTMKLAFHEGWNLSQGGEAASDFEDHYHIVGYCYCPVAFADKRTREAFRKAKLVNALRGNSDFSAWLDTL